MAAPTDDALVALSGIPGLAVGYHPAHDGAGVLSIRTA